MKQLFFGTLNEIITLKGNLRGAWGLNENRDWNLEASQPFRHASGTEHHQA